MSTTKKITKIHRNKLSRRKWKNRVKSLTLPLVILICFCPKDEVNLQQNPGALRRQNRQNSDTVFVKQKAYWMTLIPKLTYFKVRSSPFDLTTSFVVMYYWFCSRDKRRNSFSKGGFSSIGYTQTLEYL